ncbi:MAG: hypothetical protein AB8G26_14435 [Ilumatobacter sp.]
MTTVLISFLLVASWALISASQQWSARRDVQAAASAASRAAAQVTPQEIRGGEVVIDPTLAAERAATVLSASGHSGGVVRIDGLTVTVTATGPVVYAFPSPGFPGSLTAEANSSAVRGVRSEEN